MKTGIYKKHGKELIRLQERMTNMKKGDLVCSKDKSVVGVVIDFVPTMQKCNNRCTLERCTNSTRM